MQNILWEKNIILPKQWKMFYETFVLDLHFNDEDPLPDFHSFVDNIPHNIVVFAGAINRHTNIARRWKYWCEKHSLPPPPRFPLTERQPSTAFAKTLFRTHFSSQTEIEKHLISNLIGETSRIPLLNLKKTSTPTRAGLQYRESRAYPVLHPMGAPNKFLLSWSPPHDEHTGKEKQHRASLV